MKRLVWFTVTAIVTFVHVNASAMFVDGNRLHQMHDAYKRVSEGHSAERDAADGAQLAGYVQGVIDAWGAINLICVPPGTRVGQVVAMVAKYVEAHPEEWGDDGSVLVERAMLPTFACPKKVSS